MIIILQGTEFRKDTPVSAQMVLFNGMDKYVISAIEEEGKYFIYANADATKEWHPGKYTYQILTDSSLLEESTLKVKANLLYSTETKSFWQKALTQVEARLAGKTIDPADSISVGDKSIHYASIDELLKLRNFILGKIAEEEEEETGDPVSGPNDEKRIKYIWRRG